MGLWGVSFMGEGRAIKKTNNDMTSFMDGPLPLALVVRAPLLACICFSHADPTMALTMFATYYSTVRDQAHTIGKKLQ